MATVRPDAAPPLPRFERGEDGRVVMTLDGRRLPVRATQLIVPRAGERVYRLADGSARVATAEEPTPPDATHVHAVTDHLVIIEFEPTPGQRAWQFLETSRRDAGHLLRVGASPDVLPLRRATADEREGAIAIHVGDAPGAARGMRTRAAPVVDTCTSCEHPLCPAHLHVAVIALCGADPILSTGYCAHCLYFLLDDEAEAAQLAAEVVSS